MDRWAVVWAGSYMIEVGHPDQPRPETTEIDYCMSAGVLRLRGATAGSIGCVVRSTDFG